MEFSFEALKGKIEEQAKTAFIEIYEKHKDEKIYAFALYSDEGAMTVCTAANTLESLKTKDQTDLGYKFLSSEWKYSGYGADDLTQQNCSTLYEELERNEDAGDEWFEQFQKQLYDTCIAVLLKLKQENFFKNIIGEDIFLMFSATEYEFERADEVAIVTSLNDNHYRDEYLNWMKTWSL